MKKTLFITGGSRGIGRGIALVFAQNGYDVAFTYHTAENAAVTLKRKSNSWGKRLITGRLLLKKKGLRIRPYHGRQRYWERFPVLSAMQD